MSVKGPVIVCILDGWGYREDSVDNAIKLADTPNYDRFWKTGARAWLATSGLAVGLPDGQMGNSEVGHMNLGGGRVVMQNLPKIETAIESGDFAKNERLTSFISGLKESGGTAHLMGLVSSGGVHSHHNHITALAKVITDAGVPVCLHAFLDGRDTPPRSADDFIKTVEAEIDQMDGAKIATLTGRYWAMDRDKRWGRVEKAWKAITHANGSASRAVTGIDGVAAAYARGENDEFVEPTIIADYDGMKDGDGIIMANFRSDRAREILTSFVDPGFDGFERPDMPVLGGVLGMVEYSSALDKFMPAMFPSEDIKDSLGEVVSKAGLKQLRIAETEKYAHVTFFFNGGKEDLFDGEDRILVQSPDVATYDLQPEMSAPEVTEKLVEAIESGKYASIVVNYANPDMVGHTGVLSAAIEAVQAVDTAIGKVTEACVKAGGVIFITADHGNVELMKDQETGVAHTAHTNFDVPVIMMGADSDVGLKDGRLADVAPTVLELMGIDQPGVMSGNSLLEKR